MPFAKGIDLTANCIWKKRSWLGYQSTHDRQILSVRILQLLNNPQACQHNADIVSLISLRNYLMRFVCRGLDSPSHFLIQKESHKDHFFFTNKLLFLESDANRKESTYKSGNRKIPPLHPVWYEIVKHWRDGTLQCVICVNCRPIQYVRVSNTIVKHWRDDIVATCYSCELSSHPVCTGLKCHC